MILLIFLFCILLSIILNGLSDNLPHLHPTLASVKEWLLPRCSYCGASRKPTDWFALSALAWHKGGCAHCGAPHRMRDYLTEITVCLMLPAIWLANPIHLLNFILFAMSFACFLLILIHDFEHRIVLLEVVLAAALFLIADGITLSGDWALQVMIGGLVGLGISSGLYWVGKLIGFLFRIADGLEPLGFGDVLIAGLIGLWTGWPSVLPALILAIFLGGGAGIVLLIIRWVKRESISSATMAYGPYLVVAGFIIRIGATTIISLIRG